MLRFVDLTEALGDGAFAWYDTVTARFLDIEGCQDWSSWEEFKTDFENYQMKQYRDPVARLARFERLMPKGWKK